MRSEIVGLGLAAVLLSGLFFAATHRAGHVADRNRAVRPAVEEAAVNAAAQSVEKGFVGIKRVGAWTLTCAAKPLYVGGKPAADTPAAVPLNMDGKASAAPGAKPAAGPAATPRDGAKPADRRISLGRCRSLLEFRRKKDPQKVAIALIFRVVGAAPGRLVLFVRLSKGKAGDKVGLRVHKGVLEVPVRGCVAAGCTAVGVLAPATEAALTGAASGKLVMPPGPEGKRKVIRLPLVGLAASLSALRRAES